MEKPIFIIQTVSTLMMAAIIWLVQILQYPAFAFVGGERYGEFHAAHMNRISYLVAPLMIAELLSAVAIIFYPPAGIDAKILWFGLALVIIVWASTFFLQVPLHEKLTHGFDAATHAKLVETNWIRTFAWSLRGCLVIYLLWRAPPA